ncbi:RDD family protein [Erythrobacter sp. HL-111]|uniref:RDD family protein n=1 Tax=Erythrobacter sp. HL-111 TaxID=1798193 RepID=UPI0006DA6582|nr:RDD family protein [Erythrobacter sp. HL-111]KPP89450.1 MAG: putative membrane protein/domain [Erythrobacteraceae bacterium HL-111]SDS49263.1 Uncharacterized membrane protein YckC, RDD family [Erythrobacter sp. HL-111]
MSAAARPSGPARADGPADPRAKRQRSLVTPEGLALPVTIASRGSRIAALAIDFIIILFALFVIQIVFSLLFMAVLGESLGSAGDRISAAGEFVLILAILLVFAARYGYFLAFELGPRGATPGKRLVGIRVAARPGESGGGGRLTPEAVIARNLIRDIELFMPVLFLLMAPSGEQGNAGIAGLVWFLIFMAFPFFNRDALRAGDVIAGTWVVEAPRTRLAEALSTQGAAAAGTSAVTGARYDFGEEELSVYGERELQTLERILREDQAAALASVHAAICRKIGWDPGAGDERAFLEAFYAQLRAKLEGDMRFGKRKADKFS